MAVLKKIRTRWWSEPSEQTNSSAQKKKSHDEAHDIIMESLSKEARYQVRPLTTLQLDECWRLDQRCFSDGEAYSRDTFEYLLSTSEAITYRAVTPSNMMVGFIIGLIEPDRTGHITTVCVAPEHRRRHLAGRLMEKVEEGFRRSNVGLVRLEVRTTNVGAQRLYQNLGYAIAQRLPRYYSNGGDGLLMIKSLEVNKF